MTFTFATTLDALWAGEKVRVMLERTPVLLINLGGAVHAYLDRCAHQGLPLCGGTLRGNTLVCPAHQWSYDVSSGHGINPPDTRLRRFDVKVDGRNIYVDIPDAISR